MMSTLKSGLMLGVIAGMGVVSGCSSAPAYGSRGPGEIWVMSNAFGDPAKSEETASQVEEMRSWGWASQLALVNDDGSVDELVVGPFAYSNDGRSIEVSCVAFSKKPVSGQLSFSALPEYGYELPDSWVDGITREIEVSDGYIFTSVTLPVIGVPTYGVVVVWESKQ